MVELLASGWGADRPAVITPADEPKIGVETYRKVIESCSAGSYSTADVRAALRALPWYQDFYEFGYLDAAKLDRTSSETTFGNYKDFGGIKKATKVESRRDGQRFIEQEITDFKVLDKVEPGTFDEPN